MGTKTQFGITLSIGYKKVITDVMKQKPEFNSMASVVEYALQKFHEDIKQPKTKIPAELHKEIAHIVALEVNKKLKTKNIEN